MDETTEKKGGVFEKLYGATQEVIKLAKKPFVKKSLKRKYQAAFDDAETKKIDTQAELEKLRSNDLENINLNTILDRNLYIKRCSDLQEIIKQEYKLMFGKDFPIKVEED